MITNKDVPLSVNKRAINNVALEIRRSNLPNEEMKLILVHGGGSFGHYYAKKFGLSREPKRIDPKGIAQTSLAMFHLHSLVAESMLQCGIATETILPSELLKTDLSALSAGGFRHIQDSLENDLLPISFGYVGIKKRKAFIVSGDIICKAITNSMHVERVIFAMDVDGIFYDSTMKSQVISRLSSSDPIGTKIRRYDVTGGVHSKVKLGFELHKLGAQVFYLNGNKSRRLGNLLAGASGIVATQIVN